MALTLVGAFVWKDLMMLKMVQAMALVALAFLAACAAPNPRPPSVGDPVASRYVHAGPSELVLFNVINNRNGRGEHAALMINGSERVLFDPAGSWHHPTAPRQGDVHHGFNNSLLHLYTYYHARESHHVVIQRIPVSRETADLVTRLAVARGPVARANCARSISEILSQVPGFEAVRVSWWPNDLTATFATLPGVREDRIHSDRPNNPTTPAAPNLAAADRS